jgi:hypothetical protein
MVANSLGYSAPSGTTVAVKGDAATGIGASIDGSNTVSDVGSFGASSFDVIFDPTAANNPTCNDTGIDIASATMRFTVNAPKSKRETTIPLAVSYPAGNLQLLLPNTASTPATISTTACGYETFKVEAIGSSGLTLPVGAQFFVSSSDTSAVVSVSTNAPNVADPGVSSNISDLLSVASNNVNRQSVWFRVKAPSGGVAQCSTSGTIVPKTFNLNVTVLISGRRNTQTIPVTYPGN